ncbi:hypothetical protein ACFY8W_06605 [Streptomyces sp. NPDC012637]|uniref:hypothetical protein n=1 Tax=Streptomyces sp. NPDC012637 TaxID=3364842 RepID=UPI0036F09969
MTPNRTRPRTRPRTRGPAQDEQRRTRRRLVTLLALSAVLLLPLAAGLWAAAQSALEHKSATDWQGNHETRLALERAAMLLAGLPPAGAACGWTVAQLRGRQGRIPAAKGLLAGTVALWVLGIGSVFVALHDSGPIFVW